MSLASTRIAARLLAVGALAALTAGCFHPMYAEHADGTPALREKLMGGEIPPRAQAERLARGADRGGNPQRAGVQALRQRHRHAAHPSAGVAIQQKPLVADDRSGHRPALQRELWHRCTIQSDRDRFE